MLLVFYSVVTWRCISGFPYQPSNNDSSSDSNNDDDCSNNVHNNQHNQVKRRRGGGGLGGSALPDRQLSAPCPGDDLRLKLAIRLRSQTVRSDSF